MILSVLIALGLAWYVWHGFYNFKNVIYERFETNGSTYEHFYRIQYELITKSMTQAATLVAHDEIISKSFELGVDALHQEGGGKGGKKTAKYRSELLEHLLPSWQKMTQEFNVRQLHFHAPPGDTSFLRVHLPDKFGDDLSPVRHIIVDVNNDHQARSGFELGRVYSGIRSVIPVFSLKDNTKYIGALEAGTSFSALATQLSELTDANVTVMMDLNRVKKAMWEVPEERSITDCDCYIEATTSTDVALLSKIASQQGLHKQLSTHVVSIDNQPFVVTAFPIKDYLGIRDNQPNPVGNIVIWRSADAEFTLLENKLVSLLIYALIGFLIFELVLFKTVQFSFQQLELEVERQTKNIAILNQKLQKLVRHDDLTGLLNRRALMQDLTRVYDYAKRYHHECSLLMLDIDYFKKVNDQHGHHAGDLVLKAFTQLISDGRRNTDIVGRYGGEEFMIVLPETTLSVAIDIAEQIRARVAAAAITPAKESEHITCSIGVANIHDSETLHDLIVSADEALYNAKGAGRNRVMSHTQE